MTTSDRYRVVADACEKLGHRCVLIGRVHHGGFGTCAEALRAGKPSLVTPFAFDQFDTAARVHDAGLGRWLGLERELADLVETIVPPSGPLV